MNSKNILLLHRYPIQDMVEKRLSKIDHNYRLYYLSSLLTEERFADDIVEECVKLIENLNISAVVSTDDWGSLIHAALTETCSHIRGASFESEFLTMHKFYTREVVASEVRTANLRYGYWNKMHLAISADNQDHNIDSCGLDLTQFEDIDEVIVKPVMSTNSINVAALQRRDLLPYLNAKQMSEDSLYMLSQPAQLFIQKYLTKYELHTGLIVEEYFNSQTRPVSMHTFDMIVQNKRVIPFVLGDNIYWPENPTCFQGVLVPSTLKMNIQEEMEITLRHLVDVLINYGFDNQFINGEFIVSENNRIKLMEMNGRVTFQITNICDDALKNGNMVAAAIKLGLGEIVEAPEIIPGRYGFNAYINVFSSGLAGDLIDFREAGQIDEVSLYCKEDSYIDFTGDATGIRLGLVDVVATSYEDCFRKAKGIVQRISKSSVKTLWD